MATKSKTARAIITLTDPLGLLPKAGKGIKFLANKFTAEKGFLKTQKSSPVAYQGPAGLRSGTSAGKKAAELLRLAGKPKIR